MAPTTFDEAYEKVKTLVHDFKQGQARFMRTDYKEHEVRVDFIDPFFEALGWDVSHKHQRDPFRQEVKAEKTEIEGRVDYSFFKAPDFKNPVFFVEAKKPSVDIRNVQHYYQTIKYSWNAGLPVSILTDFQQLHILDCRNKAKPDDSAFAGDHRQYVFTDYLDKDKFAEIYYTFSREAIEKGNLEQYVEQLKKPKGKAIQTGLFKGGYRPIEDDFLAYIDELRETLAKALKKNNEALESEQLTEATQRIIDRLVFIRFLEDKQILDSYLVSEFGGKGDSWRDFVNTCLQLNTEYNGVVFKKHFIDDKNFAGPDDRMFRDICREICHLNSPYNFRYIPIHILGSIYEQFLGQIVHATEKRVTIVPKPEVRKAGGVYYTPKYIVEYIVDNTIGKLIKDKTPKEISKLRFADIACGSGSFLISVYEHLLDYHTAYYNRPENIVQAQKDGCRKDDDGVWQLGIEQKQEILRNNIYGVDIDAQAVEVTQLSLYLKMLENENVVTVAKHLQKKGRLFGADKILPDLSHNIKCGNSLIGSDIMSGQMFEDDELKKLNPFDYATAFPHIFKNKKVTKTHIFKPDMGINEVQEPVILYGEKQLEGGFDAIVGNPPYVMDINEIVKKHLNKNYRTSSGKPDLYRFFIQRAHELLKQEGYFGYIIPSSLLGIPACALLRKYILDNCAHVTIVDFYGQVFHKVSANTIITLTKKGRPGKMIDVYRDSSIKPNQLSLESALGTKVVIERKDWYKEPTYQFNLNLNSSNNSLIQKILVGSKKMGDVSIYTLGMQVYHNTIHTKKEIENRIYHASEKIDSSYWPESGGKNIGRYTFNPSFNQYVKYGDRIYNKPDWKFFSSKRILVREIPSEKNLICTLTSQTNVSNKSVIIAIGKGYESEFLLGILNSSLIGYYVNSTTEKGKQRLFPRISLTTFRTLPIPNLNLSNKADKAKHDHIVTLVEQMLDAKKKLSEAKTDRDNEFYTRKCEALDKQIDEAVFELYSLTEEEKEIVLNA